MPWNGVLSLRRRSVPKNLVRALSILFYFFLFHSEFLDLMFFSYDSDLDSSNWCKSTSLINYVQLRGVELKLLYFAATLSFLVSNASLSRLRSIY